MIIDCNDCEFCMKFIKLYCDRHHCDTTFLVELNEEGVHQFYTCPTCDGAVYTEIDDYEIVEINI